MSTTGEIVGCEKCEGRGHVLNKDGIWERCQCIAETVLKQKLGMFYTPTPAEKSSLSELIRTNVVIEAPLQGLRPHMARILLDLAEKGETVVVMDCYRLVEIFLEKDPDFETTSETLDYDLFVLLVGFGDPRNRYLPELVLQALSRREVLRLPTWVVLGIEREAVGMKYGVEMAGKLESFKQVRMR